MRERLQGLHAGDPDEMVVSIEERGGQAPTASSLSPSSLPTQSPEAIMVEVSQTVGSGISRPTSHSGRRRATTPAVLSQALPPETADLLFTLNIRPWLFLDLVDLAVLSGRDRRDLSGQLEILAEYGLIRTATRGNRVCFAAVP
jgi:hypothetical protein